MNQELVCGLALLILATVQAKGEASDSAFVNGMLNQI